MGFTISRFISVRPYLYHLTSERNAERISKERILNSASRLFASANASHWEDRKRRQHVTLELDGIPIDIRDQSPLYEGKMSLDGGWSFGRFIRELNSRVFFWPGRDEGMILHGLRHFERYCCEKPVLLRVSTAATFEANRETVPHFCKYNSGSPRTTQGRGSPRGPRTFVSCDTADYSASQVVEVTFLERAHLPKDAHIGTTPRGPWRRL